MKLPISVIILTYNEELNIENCLKNVAEWSDEIFIVDSYSTDRTLEIAKKYGAKVAQRPFKNQAEQFNWALDNLDIKNEWILRLDADEYLTPELWREIAEVLPKTSDKINGFYLNRRVYFMGKWIKHGGYYPTWILRLFKYGKAHSEQREMDEHIILSEGKAGKLKNDFIDYNRKNLEFWTDKHNRFSSREVRQILNPDLAGEAKVKKLGGPAALRRKLKSWYLKLPLFLRPFLYFIYRYFFRLGFLDGKEGLIFHFLQAFWYRFLVDAKIYETLKHKNTRAQEH
ncbi:MAG: glycosyltransferase family 2 protein [Patescibacteria group bacterium]